LLVGLEFKLKAKGAIVLKLHTNRELHTFIRLSRSGLWPMVRSSRARSMAANFSPATPVNVNSSWRTCEVFVVVSVGRCSDGG
jgi:hypothetical protein